MQENVTTVLNILRQQFPFLSERYNVQTLGLFGSYIRGEQNLDSDLDMLITFTETPSLLKFLAVENYLSDLLGVKVDLVMENALKPNIGQRILKEVVIV